MKGKCCRTVIFAIQLLVLAWPATVLGAEFDRGAVWPLCGRITENPPGGWAENDGCPPTRFGNAAHTDEPFSSTLGPRPLYSENDRYDFHRGLDIATPIGTPFFAVASGVVLIAGDDPSYSDPLVSVRHYRPGADSCMPGGCYTSLYLHVSSWAVAPGQVVQQGQLLGLTGESGSGFAHLHFEIRNAPSFDPWSGWSRDAIHPMNVLPYTVGGETSFAFHELDTPGSVFPAVGLTLQSARYDLLAVDIEVLDRKLLPVPQPGDVPDERGYHLLPPFFDMEWANFEYSHKDSSAFPWESFGAGGVNECPYHAEHGSRYSPHVHLDAQDGSDYQRGLFNGIAVSTLRYWPSNEGDYRVGLEFQALTGAAVCVEATATFANGPSAHGAHGACPAAGVQRLSLKVSPVSSSGKVRLSWTGAPVTAYAIYRNGTRLPVTVKGKAWTDRDVVPGGRYRYRVCPLGRSEQCSHSEVARLSR